MKQKIKGLISVALCLMLMIQSANINAATKVKINKTKVSIYVGKTVQLKITGTKKKVTWKSSNKKVATVTSKGKVKGIKKGTAKITATVSKKKYICVVKVKKKVDKNAISITETPIPTVSTTPSMEYKPIISGNIIRNFLSLKDYITKYGEINSSGNKFIKTSLGNSSFGIIYDSKNSKYTFIASGTTSSGSSDYALSMDVKETYLGDGEIKCAIIHTNGLCANLDVNASLRDINGKSELNWIITEKTGGDETIWISIANTILNIGYIGWDALVYETLNLNIKDFGFGSIQTNNTQTNTLQPTNMPIATDVNIPVITDIPITTSPSSIQPIVTPIVTNTVVTTHEAITTINPIATTVSAIVTITSIPATITPIVTSMPSITATVTPNVITTTEVPTPTAIPTFTLVPTATQTIIPTITPIPPIIPTITPEILKPIPTTTLSPIYSYIANNYSTLKEYIINHGKIDSSGNKCIQSVSGNDLFEVKYNASDKMYVYYVSGKTTDNKYSYDLKLYIDEENMNVEYIYGDIDCKIFDISNDILVQIVSDHPIYLGEIFGYGKVGWFYKNTLYTPNNTLVSVGTTALNTGYFGWRELIYDKLNLDITNFGFGDCMPYGGVPTIVPSNTPVVTPTIAPTLNATYLPTMNPAETSTETPITTFTPVPIQTQTPIVEEDIKDTETYRKDKINSYVLHWFIG